jgi:hypothetical protein
MNIPAHIYAHVLDLSTNLVNASEQGDTHGYAALYEQLRDYCESTEAAAFVRAFLLETLADFTNDDAMACDVYVRALHEAKEGNAAPFRASIQFALAERYNSLGDRDAAFRYASAANEEAKALRDWELRRSISEFLSSFD